MLMTVALTQTMSPDYFAYCEEQCKFQVLIQVLSGSSGLSSICVTGSFIVVFCRKIWHIRILEVN